MKIDNPIVQFFKRSVQNYNHEKYWRMREKVVNPSDNTNKLIKAFYLYKIKKSDAFHNASTAAYINRGAKFGTPPHLPHGLNGIIIADDTEIGKNSIIFHNVTIAQKNGIGPTIGDNCLIGTGAVLRGDINIGSNCKIGANCVLTKDLPDNHTAVGNPAIFFKNK